MEAKAQAQVKEDVLRLAKERGVKVIRLWFTDILGMLKSFTITVEELHMPWRMG